MASSVSGSNSDGHLKEDVYAVPYRTVEDLVARLHSAVTTVDTNM
jgi:hypothetical protein